MVWHTTIVLMTEELMKGPGSLYLFSFSVTLNIPNHVLYPGLIAVFDTPIVLEKWRIRDHQASSAFMDACIHEKIFWKEEGKGKGKVKSVRAVLVTGWRLP